MAQYSEAVLSTIYPIYKVSVTPDITSKFQDVDLDFPDIQLLSVFLFTCATLR